MKHIDITKKAIDILIEEFKNKENSFKIVGNFEVIVNNNSIPLYDWKNDPDNNKPGLGHWNFD